MFFPTYQKRGSNSRSNFNSECRNNILLIRKYADFSIGRKGVMVLNATFNNISAMSWWSVLLVEETGVH
jgi:hypothetical protein